MRVSVAIAVQDRGGVFEGDIVAVMPSRHRWGTEEVKHFLIVELDFPNMTSMAQAQKLTMAHYTDGVLRWIRGVDADGFPIPDFPKTGKRRFHLSFTDIESAAGFAIDWNRVRNRDDNYQPLGGVMITGLGNLRDRFRAAKVSLSDLIAVRNA